MKRILIPSCGPTDWRKLLADPELHWKRGASAFETAFSWEAAGRTARGLPSEISSAFDREPGLAGAELIFALPEHKVALKGRGRASQNDVWALLKVGSNYVSLAVEGKAGEPFDSTVGDWLVDASEGKQERLAYLCNLLETQPPAHTLRYQLLHRAASAILEGQRFGASSAVMLVQSFRKDEAAWNDFKAFAAFLGTDVQPGRVAKVRRSGTPIVYLGWVSCEPASDGMIASAV